MAKLYLVGKEESEKCGSCNWHATKVFLMADSQEEANALYGENDRGLCGECMAELLQEKGYSISQPVKSE